MKDQYGSKGTDQKMILLNSTAKIVPVLTKSKHALEEKEMMENTHNTAEIFSGPSTAQRMVDMAALYLVPLTYIIFTAGYLFKYMII